MRRHELNDGWSLVQSGSKHARPAAVPGCVHGDLLAAGEIPDPHTVSDDQSLRWIETAGWTCQCTFDTPADLLEEQRVVLACDGLDTVATITLNGTVIGEADNMFRRWRWDVKERLKAQSNRLEVRFTPVAEHVADRQGAGRSKADAFKRSLVYDRPWLRKMQCNFGWDWGPRWLTYGIWQPIRLEAFSGARLADVAVRQEHATGKVTLKVAVEAEKAGDRWPALTAVVRLTRDGTAVTEATARLSRGRGAATLEVSDPQLWWPHGLGDQPLYDLHVSLQQGETTLDQTGRTLGLRRIELLREPDAEGESFGFAVNGQPFFAKGANWIPPHVFPTEAAAASYDRLLEDAAAANFNMLRVWGGGIYEADRFYDRCDRLGLLVWQDFMFACARYPAFDRAWMASVDAEARDQVRRLRHHPCIALWCGNNECENERVVGRKWERKVTRWSGVSMSWSDYCKLFDDLLGKAAGDLDPDTPYWPASPHTPAADLDVRAHSGSAAAGDSHVWGVWFDGLSIEEQCASRHRFVSETGFQALPHPRTLTDCTPPDELNLGSPTLELRQRCQDGNPTLVGKVAQYFRHGSDFRSITYTTQVMQALVLESTIEHWRRNMDRTRGVLYWQINDCWPGITWSSIDDAGRWKALHYRVAHAYAPLLVSCVIDPETADVQVIGCSDRREPARGELTWSLWRVDGEHLDSGSASTRLLPDAATPLRKLRWAKHVAEHGRANLLGEVTLNVDGSPVSRRLVRWVRPKALALQDAGLAVNVARSAGRRYDLTLAVDRPALWTWLDLPGGDARWSDNFMHLMPGSPCTVTVETPGRLSAAALRKQLQIMTLRDSYAVPVAAR